MIDNIIFCKWCGENKNNNYFSNSQLRALNPKCKKCICEYDKIYKAEIKNRPTKRKPLTIDGRICEHCNEEKHISLFFAYNRDKKTGEIFYSYKCAECEAIYQKEYRQNNKEIISIQRKQFREINKDRLKLEKKIKNQKPEEKERRNKKQREKRKNDPIAKIDHNVANTIRDDIKNNGGKKNGSKRYYLPWSYDEFIDHIEFHFSLPGNEWMTWENWTIDGWHLDHIKPRSHFNYDSMEHLDFILCWDLSNLRPLCAKQNMLESDRRTEEQIKEILNYIKKMK